ncbi:hypothetical protein PGB90_000560 [Kerria lacca]
MELNFIVIFVDSVPMLSQTRRQEDPDGYYRLRSFSITPNGVCKNLGDCLKTRRSRSSCSVDSSPAPLQQRLIGTSSQESTNEVPVFTVGMLGASNVGKTTLSYQFTTSEYICAYDTSLDDEFGQKTVCISLNGQEAEFNIIDIPASEMSVETFCYTFNVDVFVVVYSIIDMQSFKTAEDILLYLWKNDYMASKGVILVGNKADLERRREIPASTGRKLALSWRCKFIETSSGLDHNVDELLVGIFAQVQLNPKRNRSGQQRGPMENGKQLFRQILKFGKKAKSCENLFVL